MESFSLMDTFPFGIFVLDNGFKVKYWNRQMEKWTGISNEEITGAEIADFYPGFLEPRISSRLQDVFTHQSSIVFSEEYEPHLIQSQITPDTPRYFHATVTPYHPSGQSTEPLALFTIKDVTDTVKYLQSNQELKNKLETLEASRIQVLRERDVIQRLSQKLAGLIDVKETGKTLAKESYQLFRHDAFVLLYFNEKANEFEVVYTEDTLPESPLPVEIKDDSRWEKTPIMQEIIDSQFKLINRLKEPEHSEFLMFGDIQRMSRSLMYVTIRWQGQPIGMISVQSYTPGRYGMHEVELLRTFADQCGGVLARLKYESALEETEQSLELMFEGSQDGIAHLGPRTIYHCNQKFADMFGHSVEECKRMDLTGQLHPDDREMMVDYNRRRMQGEEVPRRYEFRIVHKDGHIVYVDGTFDLLQKGEKIYGILGYFRDISQHKLMEDELRASQDLYYSLVESLPLGIFRKDIEYRYTFVNDKFQDDLGMDEQEIIGRTDFHILPASIAERTWRSDYEVLTTIEPIESIEEFQYPGEDPFYYHTIKIPLRDANGNIRGLQGMIWDVSDRVRAQEAMTRIYKAIDNSSDAIAVYDHTLRNVYYNKTFLDLFGFTIDELDQIGGVERLYTDQEKSLEIHEALSKGESWEGEIDARTKGGKILPLALRADAVRDEADTVVGRIGIYRDMTSWKKYEQELKKAVIETQEANRAKSEFLANMSHEIRTPINGIIGMTELALDSNLTAEQREYIELVKDSSESLLELINDILDFSKVEAGKLEIVSTEFSLRECIIKILHSAALRADQKGIELLYFVEQDVPDRLYGDPHRLRQVLNNLIGNSIKFTQEGEVCLWVRMDHLEDMNVTLYFEICDTGIGIPPDKQSKIFEAFEQGDTSTTRKYGGTGLGLAISLRLVELMQGKIGFESPYRSEDRADGGEGSRFWFTSKFQLTSATPLPYTEGKASLSGQRLLLVHPNRNQIHILQTYLSAWNLRVDPVPDVIAAWKAYNQAQTQGDAYSFILIDQSACKALLQHYQDESIDLPVLLLLSHTKKDETLQAFHNSIPLQYIIKPVTPSDLYNAVGHLIRGDKRQTIKPARELKKKEVEPLPVGHSGGVKILLAEDNEINQKIVIRTLEKLQYSITVANDGAEALERWAQEEFDLILMDVQMPNMDGLQATQAIRKLEHECGKHVPIIALTAHAMKGDRERCLEAGMDDYLHKPVNTNVLRERVQELLSATYSI